MSQYKTLQEGLLARDLWSTQDLFPQSKKHTEGRLRVIAKLKTPGGIRQGIWWQPTPNEMQSSDELMVSPTDVRKKVQNFDHVSRRPFVPGDRCDGSRDACSWACLWDAVRRSEESATQLMQDLNDLHGDEILTSDGRRVCIQEGAWEGIVLPRRWTREWLDRLATSHRVMNRRTLTTLLYNHRPGGEKASEGAWIDRLTQPDARLGQEPEPLAEEKIS
jgi:hypothetical protein